MTAQPPDELSQRLQAALGPDYEVQSRLGAGGFAVVFLVQDLRLKRRLAVKVLSPDLIASRSVMERFRHEAETIAQLSHPNIVPLHFIGGSDDMLYLVMGFADGGSLADRLKREPQLPLDDARRVLVEVASALGHAHKRGVIHRDIKPHNVLLDAESGRASVTDFGIARSGDSAALTASGVLLGTPAYLAPEQVTGEPSDHRADIYSLGVMAYEMIAGRPPFEAPTASAVMMKRLAGPPAPVSSLRPDVPSDLEGAIDGCLASSPEDRFQSADDVMRALTGQTPSSGGHRTSSDRTAQPRGRRPWWLGAAALLGVAGAVALWVWKGAPETSAQPITAAPVDSGMVLIPSGDYPIGFDSGPANARPEHRVTLPAFGINRREVTVGEYRDFVATGDAPAPWPLDSQPPADFPVTRVTFYNATAYCRWRHPDGGRLPTEQEWESAARGSAGRRFPWGDDALTGRANVARTGRAAPVPVGTYPTGATPDGIVDLIGNVWEWTSSQRTSYPDGALVADSTQFRVIRGGAYNSIDAIATPYYRYLWLPSASPDDLAATGFRCAMTPRAGTPASR